MNLKPYKTYGGKGDNVFKKRIIGLTASLLMIVTLASCGQDIAKEATQKGVHAGNIIKEITAIAGGRGGGKPDMAQGGGSDASKIQDALDYAKEVIKNQLN